MSQDHAAGLRRLLSRLGWAAAVAALLSVRSLWPARSLHATGPIALRDLALTLLFFALLLVLAAAAGSVTLRTLRLPGATRLERSMVALAVGIGLLGYAAFGLALAGALSREWIAAMLIAVAVWVGPEAARIAARAPAWTMDTWRRLSTARPLPKATAIFLGLIGALAFLHALSPPWDYDGLMYHLVGPQMFLDAGRIVPSRDNWYVNGPFTVQMVFSLGMAFGDDVFPKLVHYTMGVLLVGSTIAAGRRWLSQDGGWLSAAVLMGVPTLPVWAAFAYIDLGWAVFEFLALYAVLVWWQGNERTWLAIAGVLLGLAMGSKYLGLQGFAIVGLLVLSVALRRGLRPAIAACATLGVPAVLVAAPWYVKNAIWFGNPVYPLYFGGPGWDATRLDLYSQYLHSFGVGRGFSDFVLLPLNIYTQHARFGTVMNEIDIPAVLFPLAAIVPFMQRRRPVLSLLLVAAAARFGLWSVGSQQIRFLLPIYPALAVLAAAAILYLQERARARPPWHLFLPTLAVGLLSLTLFYQVVLHLEYRPLPSVLGIESRHGFLERTNSDYPAVAFAKDHLPPGSRVLLLGDGQSYYCGSLCLPDPDHFRWAGEIQGLGPGGDLGAWFAQHGVSHVLLSAQDLNFFLQHDARGAMRHALERLLAWREQGCLREVYADEWTRLYAIACP